MFVAAGGAPGEFVLLQALLANKMLAIVHLEIHLACNEEATRTLNN